MLLYKKINCVGLYDAIPVIPYINHAEFLSIAESFFFSS